jgi:DNA-binding transcriptional MerR regulator
MLKIGDFSKLSQVSVKTLRFYDEIGLLKPTYVDRFTGIRHSQDLDSITRLYNCRSKSRAVLAGRHCTG